MRFYPNYYKDFTCIADKCKHNCCVFWEIDIDDDTLDFYSSVDGDFGERLKNNIAFDDNAHFILTKDERCPFLNNKNLCDIICRLGEEHLCDICTQHPRFHNELPQRIESGLGLCCEEASRIIIGQKDKMTLVCDTNAHTDDEIIIIRDKILNILQNRNDTIPSRIESMLNLCNTTLKDRPVSVWCDLLLSLEILDEKWKELLIKLKENYRKIDYKKFDEHMRTRTTEYEQFCVYIIYRHFANSPDFENAKKRACFTAFAYKLLYNIGAMIYTITDEFSFESQVDIARMFSTEIEYSDENLHLIFSSI